jgi:hypothetical protein
MWGIAVDLHENPLGQLLVPPLAADTLTAARAIELALRTLGAFHRQKPHVPSENLCVHVILSVQQVCRNSTRLREHLAEAEARKLLLPQLTCLLLSALKLMRVGLNDDDQANLVLFGIMEAFTVVQALFEEDAVQEDSASAVCLLCAAVQLLHLLGKVLTGRHTVVGPVLLHLVKLLHHLRAFLVLFEFLLQRHVTREL